MVHILNRKEVLITWSPTELANAREILASNNIEYKVKTAGQNRDSFFGAGSRARTGSFGLRTDAMYRYSIYVRKEDYEKARTLLCR